MSEDAEAAGGCDVCKVKCWTMEGFFGFGQYSYKYMCTPQLPCVKVNPPLFMSKDEKLPLLLAMVMGFQHMLGMVAGIATSGGFLIAGEACWAWSKDSKMCEQQSFLISTAWMTSGILTLVQVFRVKIKGTPFFLGTGLISVMGTSFTFLPLGQAMVSNAIAACKQDADPRCVAGDCQTCGLYGYGKYIGTAICASVFEVVIALLPKKVREKIFPPLICGIALMMIGAGLISAGVKYLGGGVFCAQNMLSKAVTSYEHPFMGDGVPHICNEAGDVYLPFGAPEHIGLGLAVVLFGVFIQMLGSPFLKSTFIFWSLIFGCVVSLIAKKHDDAGNEYSYWNSKKIDAAPPFTFLWVGVAVPGYFGFAPEYFIPMLICAYVTTAETVGDVLMTCQFSAITEQEEVDKRIQGGILADGVNSVIAGMFGSPPNTTFSGNNGVIAISRCASRSAGFSCGIQLILIGMIGKLGAIFASVPMPVVGGMTLQTFTMVFVAGIEVVGKAMNRRNSYIIMVSLCFGLGVAMEPHIFEANGKTSFYGKNLNFNYGLWPQKMTCDVFPSKTVVITPASCSVGSSSVLINPSDAKCYNGAQIALSSDDCTALGGTYTAAVTETVDDTDCANLNGFCCVKYNAGAASMRLTLMVIIKTPYAIAPVIAMILNFIIPNDVDVDESPKAGGAESAEA